MRRGNVLRVWSWDHSYEEDTKTKDKNVWRSFCNLFLLSTSVPRISRRDAFISEISAALTMDDSANGGCNNNRNSAVLLPRSRRCRFGFAAGCNWAIAVMWTSPYSCIRLAFPRIFAYVALTHIHPPWSDYAPASEWRQVNTVIVERCNFLDPLFSFTLSRDARLPRPPPPPSLRREAGVIHDLPSFLPSRCWCADVSLRPSKTGCTRQCAHFDACQSSLYFRYVKISTSF